MKKHISHIFSLISSIFLSFLLAACIHFGNPDPCNPCYPQAASAAGSRDASDGHMPNFAGGAICPMTTSSKCLANFTPEVYKQNYLQGYEEAQSGVCNSEAAFKRGYTDQQYNSNSSSYLKICTPNKYNYDNVMAQYKKGESSFVCSEARLTENAKKSANKYEKASPDSVRGKLDIFCKAPQKLIQKYQEAYHKNLKLACQPAQAQRYGYSDGTNNYDRMNVLQICPEKQVEKAQQSYLKGFNEGKSYALEQEKLRFEKKKQQEKMEMAQRQLQIQQNIADWHRFHFYDYVYGGHTVGASCSLDSMTIGRIRFYNRSPYNSVSVSGNWKVVFYNAFNMPVGHRVTHVQSYLYPHSRGIDTFYSIPIGATSCRVFPY